MKKLISYFTLKYVTFAFVDIVNYRGVNIYQDCYGDRYLKHSRWDLFSVKIERDRDFL